ncbi:36645_t:CDS:2 [Gigaspora margarita]|uniref:36645_t:CDS:1 n=1 Tax=Gigaspora margarita TaxID=4874 RepID=A0ABN7W7P9_GIGMA|nr:36645_t:CDS:2 [Gigaspora margarita]
MSFVLSFWYNPEKFPNMSTNAFPISDPRSDEYQESAELSEKNNDLCQNGPYLQKQLSSLAPTSRPNKRHYLAYLEKLQELLTQDPTIKKKKTYIYSDKQEKNNKHHTKPTLKNVQTRPYQEYKEKKDKDQPKPQNL